MSYEELLKEFEYYIQNQDEFVEQYDGKVIVLKNNKIIGIYQTEIEALTETQEEHEIGSFLIQRVSPGIEAYTINIATPEVMVA